MSPPSRLHLPSSPQGLRQHHRAARPQGQTPLRESKLCYPNAGPRCGVGPAEQQEDCRQRSRSRSPSRAKTAASSSQHILGMCQAVPMPAATPGVSHWLEPLWASLEGDMRGGCAPTRRLTLESLCTGTGAEFHAMEVHGQLLGGG